MATEIYKILESIMEKQKMSVADIARACNLPDSTVRGIISRKQKSIALEVAFKLSRGLNVSLATLNGEPSTPLEVSPQEMTHIKKYRTLDRYGKTMVDTVLDLECKRYEEYKAAQTECDECHIIEMPSYLQTASAGYGNWLEEAEEITITVPDTPMTRQADFAIRVSGDSMEPKYSDGDLVFVKKQDDIEVGEYGIWIVDGDAYIKKRGVDRLISLNHQYPDVEQGENVHCVGKVIGKL